MPSVEYITPITNRTHSDVEYARMNQADLVNKNIGAWNYTDANRVCNNLKYAAEYMYEQGFLLSPYVMQIKLDWKETDIITYEQLNDMIVNNMNNLKTYARPDLEWYQISSIVNMNYTIANWLEKNIDALATQQPIPPDKYKLTVNNGSGSGEYEANTVVQIEADSAEEGQIFDHWSGDHLENIENATASITNYKMPYQDITLQANYTSAVPHTLTVITYTNTDTVQLSMGEIHYIEADPAPQGKVFHHWEVNPNIYEDNLFEPSATTHFTMPNENVTLTAIYITKGEKQLIVTNGNGSGYYDYDTYAPISSTKPSNATFTSWTGDTQYLTGPVTQEYNSVKIPDVAVIRVRANWTTPPSPPTPPATNVLLKVVNGVITSTGETEGRFTQGDKVEISANPVTEGQIFTGWSRSGGGSISNSSAMKTAVTIGSTATTVTASYRMLEYHDLTVITHSGTTTKTLERYDYFSVDANPAPDNYTFDKWTGDTRSYNSSYYYGNFDVNDPTTGTYMGTSDRTITATYRPINPHTLTVKQLSGDVTYEQAEFSTVRITAEDAPEGKRFTGWSKSGAGQISSSTSKTTTFTFGNGDCTLTPNYVNVWTITVTNGTIDGKSSALLDEGSSYRLSCRSLAVYERFDGWVLDGPGSVRNEASTSTYFTVGNNNTTITANISQYPDKTLTVYFRDPDTNIDSLVSQQSYQYGSRVVLEAPIAPDKTTFASWLGDIEILGSSSALASSITITSLEKDATLIATYYYPEAPKYFTLTVYDGSPNGQYTTGTQVPIRANEPSQGWEFCNWYGDTQFLVNPDITLPENSVIMPLQSVTLHAKFNVIGELPLYRVSVKGGIAKGSYTDSHEIVHNEEGVYIDIPAGTEVELIADKDEVGFVFDYWYGNFEAAGITDIVTTKNPTTFTMTNHDVNIEMKRRELDKYTVYPTDATTPGTVYPGTYSISGTLQNTDEKHYIFQHWLCVDADGNDCIEAIEEPNKVDTRITLTDKDLWITAVYETYYRLTVIEGQDSGSGYYAENEKVNTVYANTPPEGNHLQFDHWEDPVGIIENIYDPTPNITMKNTIATITAVFVSTDQKGNSVVVTGNDLHTGIIRRSKTTLINGIFAVGTIAFDGDGCIGVITEVDPDKSDDTDDYKVEKLFYGGNF